MSVYAQPFDHALNARKGWPSPAAVDYVAKISANVLYPLRAGQCVHLNSVGEYEPGVANTQMPIFLFQGAEHYDVANPGGNRWVAIQPTGMVMGIVAKAAVELETTEFVPGTYAPNEPLRSPTGNSAGAEALTNDRPTTSSSGVLRNDAVTLGTTAIVGTVSSGVRTNYNNKEVLAFWPEHIMGTA